MFVNVPNVCILKCQQVLKWNQLLFRLINIMTVDYVTTGCLMNILEIEECII